LIIVLKCHSPANETRRREIQYWACNQTKVTGGSAGADAMTTIYKICDAAQWAEAECAGEFRGSAVDRADGYIHFSTAAQAGETAAKHFAGMVDLVLVSVSADALGGSLKWEPSRAGALFPHLYGMLPMTAVRWTKPLLLGADGIHVFPAEMSAEE
jgi:uncharacterized protein (DUF952 family)